MEELVFYRVGLDKQVWKNINILKINNLNKLLSKSNVSVSGGQVYKRIINTSVGVEQVGKIKICDEIFMLEFGVVARNGNINKLQNYEKLEFNPSSILNQGINFNPIVNSSQLIEVIEIIKSRLQNQYGIIVDFDDARIKKCEININIPLDYDMKNYQIPLEFLLHKILNHKKKFALYHEGYFNAIYSANKNVEFKIYEKNKECNLFLNNDTARLEYKLLEEEKVFNILKTTKIKDVLKDFSIIENSFYKMFEDDIYSKLNKVFDKLVKDNLKIFNSFKSESQQFKSYLSSIDVNSTFDYLVVKKMISQTNLKKNQKSNMKFIAYKKLREKQTQMIGNIELLNEILIKLNYNPIKL
ncbi:TPA: hypothetical protein ACG3JX_003839 [Clostridioides difficile]